MKLETRFGTLDLPRRECIGCIYHNVYMSCTACEFKDGLIEAAAQPYHEWMDTFEAFRSE